MIILEKLPAETGRDYALRNLKENIIYLHLEPGAKISEKDITSLLGLSRTPVREALLELSKVNIVEIFPQKGSNIALIDFDQVEESHFMRTVLESAAAKLCCEVATDNDLKLLDEKVKLQEFYLNNKTSNEHMIMLDNEFHKTIFDIIKKPQVYKLIRNQAIHLDRMRTLTLGDIPYSEVVDFHKKIVTAISSRNSELAQTLVNQHISNYQRVEETVYNRYPHYFKT